MRRGLNQPTDRLGSVSCPNCKDPVPRNRQTALINMVAGQPEQTYLEATCPSCLWVLFWWITTTTLPRLAGWPRRRWSRLDPAIAAALDGKPLNQTAAA